MTPAEATVDVAATILTQLGGPRFIAMTGANRFLRGIHSLSFRLPANFARRGINHIRITLDADDTYSVFFGRVRGTRYNIISQHGMVYADGLQRLFRDQTGLDTSLGGRV